MRATRPDSPCDHPGPGQGHLLPGPGLLLVVLLEGVQFETAMRAGCSPSGLKRMSIS